MANTKKQIIDLFNKHLALSGRRYYSEFYIGVTNDVNRRLFQEHNVKKETMWWAYSTASAKKDAEAVERHFLKKGMKGNKRKGTDESTIVYCYAITPTTVDK